MKKLQLPSPLMTGHAVIDAEHNKIVDLINRCVEIIEGEGEGEGKGDERLYDALLKLTNTIRRHFRHEEKIMEGIGYKNIEKHRDHHDGTLSDLDTIFDIVSNGVLPKEWVIHTIIHLFISDVVIPDKNIKDYVLEKNHKEPQRIGPPS